MAQAFATVATRPHHAIPDAFIPAIFYPERTTPYLQVVRFPRKAKSTPDAAIAYAARVIWYRQMRAAEKRRRQQATATPWWFELANRAA